MTPNDLIAVGGKLWEKNGKRRIYFNKLRELMGLEIHFYPAAPGRQRMISHATLRGKDIEISEARDLYELTRDGKFWYDVDEKSFCGRGLTSNVVDMIKQGVQDAGIALLAAQPADVAA